MPNSAPDFTKEYLPQSELVDWLCTLGETSAFVRRNILEQIRLAIKKGELPGPKWKKGKRSLELQSFLSWATTKKGWNQAIRATPGVTVNISVFVSGVEATAITRSVFSGPPEIARIEELEEENKRLKSENKLLKEQKNKPYSDEKYLSDDEEKAKSLWQRAF